MAQNNVSSGGSTFREGWITVNQVPTHVITWGCWIDEPIETDSIMVCITGTPGLPDFYITFLSKLYELIKMPIWIINYAGCEIPNDKALVVPSIKVNRHLYDFKGQIQHKYDFITRYIPKDKCIYMIGHSLGAKLVVELLKHEELCLRTEQTYLLFPTLEHMSETRNGRFVSKILPYFITFLLYTGWVLEMMPEVIKRWLLALYFRLRTSCSVDHYCMSGGRKLFNSKVMLGVFYLTQDGLENIKELDYEVLNNFGHKINCYYSKTDGWAPPLHYENLKKNCPSVKAVLMEDKFKHAFVLSTPVETASLIADEINNFRKKS